MVSPRLTGNDVVPHSSGKPQEIGTTSVSSHTHAVEFSRTGAVEAGNEKASAHARGLRFDGLRKWSYPNRVGELLVAGTFTASLAGGRWSLARLGGMSRSWLASRLLARGAIDRLSCPLENRTVK